ncbi:MAG: polysaccharide biosynthesis protein [Solirubrobacterales bacterium]|nr:polysaccharide biosynthesis protein [Solirubrobacterales bacterium]
MSAGPPEDDGVVAGAVSAGSRLLVLRLLQYVFLFAGSLLVARALGPAGRAQYVLPLTLATLVALVAGVSLEQSAGRLLGRREARLDQLMSSGMGLIAVLGSLGTLVTVGLGLLLRDDLLGGAPTTAVLLAAAIVIPTQITSLAAGMLLRVGALRTYGLLSAAASALQLLVVIVLYAADALTVERALLVNVVGVALGAAAMAAAMTRHVAVRALLPRLDRAIGGALLRVGAALHPGTLSGSLNVRMDLLVVGALSSAHATGVYSLATTIADAAMLAALTVGQTALHVQVREEPAAAARYTAGFARQCFLLAAATTLIASAVMYPFFALLYGREWTGAVVPCIVLLVAISIATPEAPIRFLLIQLGRPGHVSLAAMGCMAANLALDVVLVPPFGIVGASIATLISSVGYTAVILWLFGRETGVSARHVFRRPRLGEPALAPLAARWPILRARS